MTPHTGEKELGHPCLVTSQHRCPAVELCCPQAHALKGQGNLLQASRKHFHLHHALEQSTLPRQDDLVVCRKHHHILWRGFRRIRLPSPLDEIFVFRSRDKHAFHVTPEECIEVCRWHVDLPQWLLSSRVSLRCLAACGEASGQPAAPGQRCEHTEHQGQTTDRETLTHRCCLPSPPLPRRSHPVAPGDQARTGRCPLSPQAFLRNVAWAAKISSRVVPAPMHQSPTAG